MTPKRLFQDLRGKVLWELASHGGKMKRSRLRRRIRTTLAELEPILLDLERKGKIEISDLKQKRQNQLITMR